MAERIDTVIFDLDGTLLDTLGDLTDALNYIMNVYGYPERTIEEVRAFVGNGLGRLIRRAVPDYVTDAKAELITADLKEYYTVNCMKKTKPYSGIIELLDELVKKGIKLAVVSNKNDVAVKELCSIFFGDRIKVCIGERIGVNRKPAPDSVLRAVEELESSVKTAIYVGDSEVDIQTAKNANMQAVLVTWGFRDKDMLIENGAMHFADNAQDILKYIEK